MCFSADGEICLLMLSGIFSQFFLAITFRFPIIPRRPLVLGSGAFQDASPALQVLCNGLQQVTSPLSSPILSTPFHTAFLIIVALLFPNCVYHCLYLASSVIQFPTFSYSFYSQTILYSHLALRAASYQLGWWRWSSYHPLCAIILAFPFHT